MSDAEKLEDSVTKLSRFQRIVKSFNPDARSYIGYSKEGEQCMVSEIVAAGMYFRVYVASTVIRVDDRRAAEIVTNELRRMRTFKYPDESYITRYIV